MSCPGSETSSRSLDSGLDDSEQLPELPDDIISDIFSACASSPNLTNKQAILLGLSSKANFRRVQNRPALMFDGRLDVKRYREELDYFHETLRRYHYLDIHLETLTFKFRGYDRYFEETGKKCMNLATKRNLKSLELSTAKKLKLPDSVYKLESLEQLSLREWELHYPIGGIDWPNLKRLCLDSVNTGFEILDIALTSCPLIESLEIHSCCQKFSDYKFKVSNLNSLKQLTLGFRCDTQTLLVCATPNLESIVCTYESRTFSRSVIPISYEGQLGYPNLRTLSLNHCHCEAKDGLFIADFSRTFPQLEELSMDTNKRLRRISLSSQSLKKIRLANMVSLEKARFKVPNVLLFEFRCYNSNYTKLSFTGNPDGWVSRIITSKSEQRIECGAKWCWPTSSRKKALLPISSSYSVA